MKFIRNQQVLEIVFDDLDSKNSFSLEHAQCWLKEATTHSTELMILRSEGSVFCSGGNLAYYAAMASKAEGVHANAEIRHCLELIDKMPCLKVAFVSGDCFGGGIEVLSLCDQIFSLNHVFFGMWQSRMHLSFGWGGFTRLTRRMNRAALQLWLGDGGTRSAYGCLQQGLIDEILSPESLLRRYEALKVVAHKKGARYFSQELVRNEGEFFEELWWSDDHKQALSKFKP